MYAILLYEASTDRICVVGRPWLYGGIVAGQEGVEQVLRHTLADLDTTLAISGFSSLCEIQGKAEEILVEM